MAKCLADLSEDIVVSCLEEYVGHGCEDLGEGSFHVFAGKRVEVEHARDLR